MSASRLLGEPRPSEGDESLSGDGDDVSSPRFRPFKAASAEGVDFTNGFDPSSWIVCCGVLEKKRDGAWREGWARRWFVLGKHALYYFINAKTDKAGYTPLLGEERGQIKLSDLTECKITGQDKEFCYIQLVVKNLRKQNPSGYLQAAVYQISLRTPLETGQMWYDALTTACRRAQQGQPSLPGMSYTSSKSMVAPPRSPMKPAPPLAKSPSTSSFKGQQKQTVLDTMSLEEAFPFAQQTPLLPLALAVVAMHVAAEFVPPEVGLAVVPRLFAALALDVVLLGMFLLVKKREVGHDTLVREARLRLSLAKQEIDRLTQEAQHPPPESFTKSQLLEEDEEDLEEEDGDDGTFRAGSSMTQVESPAALRPGETFMSWCNADSHDFKLRIGPNYKKNGLKAPSLDSMYSLIAVDFVKSKDGTRLSNIMSHPERVDTSRLCMFDDVGQFARAGVPKLFVINAQVPGNSPSLFADDKADVGYSLVLYLQCKKELLHSILTCDPPVPPAVKLLQDYVKDHATNPDIRRRFKGLGIAEGVKDVGIPGVNALIDKFQGKPAIMNKVAEIYESEKKYEWFEVDISIFQFPFLGKKALNAMMDRVSELNLKAGFTLQGEGDDELPECLLGAVNFAGLDFRLAQVI